MSTFDRLVVVIGFVLTLIVIGIQEYEIRVIKARLDLQREALVIQAKILMGHILGPVPDDLVPESRLDHSDKKGGERI